MSELMQLITKEYNSEARVECQVLLESKPRKLRNVICTCIIYVVVVVGESKRKHCIHQGACLIARPSEANGLLNYSCNGFSICGPRAC